MTPATTFTLRSLLVVDSLDYSFYVQRDLRRSDLVR
jgi:hypothetical protein